MEEWSEENGLRLNPWKTEIIHFFRKRRTPFNKISLPDGSKLSLIKEVRFLGIWLD